MSRREVVYAFPNPWKTGPSTPYGVDGTDLGDRADGATGWSSTATACWTCDVDVLDDVLASGAFEVVVDHDGIVVARRVQPPSPATGGY